MTSIKSVIIAAVGSVCGLAADLRSDVGYVEPPSVETLLSIGGVRIDGSLQLSYVVGDWILGPHERIPINIVHRLKTDPSGHPVSEMAVTGLTAFSAPTDRYGTRCVFLGGTEITFNSSKIGPVPSMVAAGVSARSPDAGYLEIRSNGGWRWLYENGRLIAAEGPNLLRISVLRSQGAKLVSLKATRLGGLVGELNAQYDRMGNIRTLTFGAQRHHFEYSGPRNHMTLWLSTVDGSETKTQFEYENDLLVRVTRDGVTEREIRWMAVPMGLTADTEWPAPVRVSQLGKLRYSYDLDHKGYSMLVKEQNNNITQKRVLNTNRGTVSVFENGKPISRVFFGVRRGRPEAGKVIRVEDPSGSVITRYSYDELGRVSAYWTTAGQLDFHYDNNPK